MSDEPNKGEEKKIIIDEDWKSRVEAERDELESQSAEPAETAPDADTKQPEQQWPEPSLTLLATTLATQAMMALGYLPHPVSGKQDVNLPQAKHFIDTIQLLQEKTEGNRQPEESAALEGMLHDLRMGYVGAQQKQGS